MQRKRQRPPQNISTWGSSVFAMWSLIVYTPLIGFDTAQVSSKREQPAPEVEKTEDHGERVQVSWEVMKRKGGAKWEDWASQVVLVVKSLPAKEVDVRDTGSVLGLGRSPLPGRGENAGGNSPVFLPGESHGQRSLASYSPWGHRVRHGSDLAHRGEDVSSLLIRWFCGLRWENPCPLSAGEADVKRVCAQSREILWDPTDCSLPVSSVHGISRARILEWVAISFSRGSSWPMSRDPTHVSWVSCTCRKSLLLPLGHLGSPSERS